MPQVQTPAADRFDTVARHRIASLKSYARGRFSNTVFMAALCEAVSFHASANEGFRRLLEGWQTVAARVMAGDDGQPALDRLLRWVACLDEVPCPAS